MRIPVFRSTSRSLRESSSHCDLPIWRNSCPIVRSIFMPVPHFLVMGTDPRFGHPTTARQLWECVHHFVCESTPHLETHNDHGSLGTILDSSDERQGRFRRQ